MKNKLFLLSSFIIFIFIIFTTSCFNRITYNNSFSCFSTVVDITIYDTKNSNKYFKEIKTEMKKIHNSTNYYNGELYELNKNRSIDASDYLIDVLNYSIELKELTNGYFNPLVGRLVNIYKDEDKYKDITDELIQNELEIINNSYINIEGNYVSIYGDANIDLGAITKGYATKWCKEYFSNKGIKKYIINCGESSISCGTNCIKVGLLVPGERDEYFKKVNLKNEGISTSNLGYQAHHIINPLTGYQESYYESLSIISDNDLYNDAFSTACFNMDLDSLNKFRDEQGFKYIIYTKEKEVING